MCLATLALIAMCRAGRLHDEMRDDAGYHPRTASATPSRAYSGARGRTAVGWEEIAMRTDRTPRPRSTKALRRRHLAAILPADARR
jgi:hypothetical protein